MNPWTLEQLAKSRLDDVARSTRFAALLADAAATAGPRPSLPARWGSLWAARLARQGSASIRTDRVCGAELRGTSQR